MVEKSKGRKAQDLSAFNLSTFFTGHNYGQETVWIRAGKGQEKDTMLRCEALHVGRLRVTPLHPHTVTTDWNLILISRQGLH